MEQNPALRARGSQTLLRGPAPQSTASSTPPPRPNARRANRHGRRRLTRPGRSRDPDNPTSGPPHSRRVEKRPFLDRGVGGARNAFGVAAGDGSVVVVGGGVGEGDGVAAARPSRIRTCCAHGPDPKKNRALSVRTGECDLGVTERRCSVPACRTVVGKAARRFIRDAIGSADLERT